MITRVTTVTMMRAASENLQAASSELLKLQNQASSQKAIGVPSDDPSATAAALRTRAAQAANAQYARNIQDGSEWLTTIDSTLGNVNNLLQSATNLTVQGANDGAMSPSAKEAIAVELESIRDALISAANTTYLGRSVFAGNSDTGAAFDANYAYSGGDGTVERRITDGTTIRVDADGATIFGTGANSVFAEIDRIAADLRAGVNIGPRLTALTGWSESASSGRATAGAQQSTLITAAASQKSKDVALEAQRVSLEDVGLADIVLRLTTQETMYQAALAVSSRALQPTLMDFLS
jgi:flagellar hook-associated protein 3 FlgL